MKRFLGLLFLGFYLAGCDQGGDTQARANTWFESDEKIIPAAAPQFGPDVPICATAVNGNIQLKNIEGRLYFGCMHNGLYTRNSRYQVWQLDGNQWRSLADIDLGLRDLRAYAFRVIKDDVYILTERTIVPPSEVSSQLLRIDKTGAITKVGPELRRGVLLDYADLEVDKSGRIYVGILEWKDLPNSLNMSTNFFSYRMINGMISA